MLFIMLQKKGAYGAPFSDYFRARYYGRMYAQPAFCFFMISITPAGT